MGVLTTVKFSRHKSVSSSRRERVKRNSKFPIRRGGIDKPRKKLLCLYSTTVCLYGQEEQHTSTLGHNPFSRFTLVFLITYLAERSAVFAVAVGCRPLPRCSRCGCPAECYDHCHCSSPNLRTGSQDTSITTHVLTEGLRPDAIAKRALLSSRNAHSPHSYFFGLD